MSARWKDHLPSRRWVQHMHMFARRHTGLYYAVLPLVVACGSSTPPTDGGVDAANTPDTSGTEVGPDAPTCAALGENCGGNTPCCDGICSVLAGDLTATCN
jgi:hypothetical protein